MSALLVLAACKEPETPPPVVEKFSVQPLAEILTHYEYRASAQAFSQRYSDIAAEINATVAAVIKDTGDTVNAGETLIELDCRETESIGKQSEATLAALKAREALARQQLKRAKRLRKSRSISEEELNQKQSTLDAAAAERQAQAAHLEIAKLNVERCSIKAPFAGVITERFVQEGERLSVNTRVLHLVDHENLQIQAQIPAEAAASLEQGQNIHFSHNQKTYPAELQSLAAVIDSRTQTQAARFTFTSDKPKAGTLGHMVWADVRPTLPISFVLKRDNQEGLFYAESNRARFHPLTDVQAGKPIYIDLAPETLVITDGRMGLSIDQVIELNIAP